MEYWKFTEEDINNCISSLLADRQVAIGMTVDQIRSKYFKKPEDVEVGTLEPRYQSAVLKPSEWAASAYGVSAPYSEVIPQSGGMKPGFLKPVSVPYLCIDTDEEGKVTNFVITRDGSLQLSTQLFAVPTLPKTLIANAAGWHSVFSSQYALFATGRGIHNPKSYTAYRNAIGSSTSSGAAVIYYASPEYPFLLSNYPLGGKLTKFVTGTEIQTNYTRFAMLSDEVYLGTNIGEVLMLMPQTSLTADDAVNYSQGPLQRIMIPSSISQESETASSKLTINVPVLSEPKIFSDGTVAEYPIVTLAEYISGLVETGDIMSIDEIITELSGRFAAV